MKTLLYMPGQQICPELLENLKNLNYSRNNIGFPTYRRCIGLLLKKEKKPMCEKMKRFLGGFILGEGSINVSIKRNENSITKVTLDPQFSVTQHINSCSHLLNICDLFQTGRIYYKAGSNATLVYVIDSRLSIQTKVLPFWRKYILPFQSKGEITRFTLFEKILVGFSEGKHLETQTLVHEMLPLWDALRKQKGQINETFQSLQHAQQYVLSGGNLVQH